MRVANATAKNIFRMVVMFNPHILKKSLVVTIEIHVLACVLENETETHTITTRLSIENEIGLGYKKASSTRTRKRIMSK